MLAVSVPPQAGETLAFGPRNVLGCAGRMIFRSADGKFEVQLPNDNRWKGFDSIEETAEGSEEEERPVVATITIR
jgi:hypothetical protein